MRFKEGGAINYLLAKDRNTYYDSYIGIARLLKYMRKHRPMEIIISRIDKVIEPAQKEFDAYVLFCFSSGKFLAIRGKVKSISRFLAFTRKYNQYFMSAKVRRR